MPMTFADLQREQAVWSRENFGDQPVHHPLLGINEELGEFADAVEALIGVADILRAVGRLNHATLKEEQGIRGEEKFHEAMAKDAIGDMLIFLAGFCTIRGWDLQEIVEAVWVEVKPRNWKQSPHNGLGIDATTIP